MKLVPVLSVAVLLGGIAGAAIAFRLMGREESEQAVEEPGHAAPAAAGTEQPPRDGDAPGQPRDIRRIVESADAPVEPTISTGSFYLDHYRPLGLAIDQMTPLLVTPRRSESIPMDCPEMLVVRTAEESYEKEILPWLRALGPCDFDVTGATELAREAAQAITNGYRELCAVAGAPVGASPLRILVKHYPYPNLPGRCVTIQAIFYTVFDPVFDAKSMVVRRDANGVPVELDGILWEVRKSYQLEGAEPKLIEAALEVQTKVRPMPRRQTFAEMQVKDEEWTRAGASAGTDEHFLSYGGGERRGFIWFDLAAGLKEPRIRAQAYRIVVAPGRPGAEIVSDELTPFLLTRLLSMAKAE